MIAFMAITAYNLQFSSMCPHLKYCVFFLNIWFCFVVRIVGFLGLNMSQRNRPVYRSGAAALVVLWVEDMQSAVDTGVRRPRLPAR